MFEYLQNQALDAIPYGFTTKAPKKFNTFGFSLGGPVTIPHLYNRQNKTFFFVDYEGNRRTTAAAQQFVVPTQAERNGDLRGFNPSLAPIPAASISPTAKALLRGSIEIHPFMHLHLYRALARRDDQSSIISPPLVSGGRAP